MKSGTHPDYHLINVEMTDGTREYNATNYRVSTFYDLAKSAILRLAFSQGEELAPHACTAVALTPGWLRSEIMLENYGVTEDNWRDGARINPHFAAISESPRFVGRAVAALAADPHLHERNGGELCAMSIDVRESLMEYLQKFYKLGRAGTVLEKAGAVDFATTIAPGLRDVLLIGKVYEAAGRPRGACSPLMRPTVSSTSSRSCR